MLLLTVLIEGVLFRARYLGSTQLISDGQPSKAVRMLQAQEAIGRIKVTVHSMLSLLPIITIFVPVLVKIPWLSIIISIIIFFGPLAQSRRLEDIVSK